MNLVKMEDGKIRVKNVLHFLFLFVFNQCEGRVSLCVCLSVCECVRIRKCVCAHDARL